MSRAPVESAGPRRCVWLLLGVAMVVGLMLRLAGCRTELWLDELWAIDLVGGLKSPWQVFTNFAHESNHHLMSVWIWTLGDNQSWWAYRVPSVMAGMAAVLVAIRIGLRQSRATSVVAGVLASLSYLMVLYSSEARGYAIACCMALVAYDQMERYLSDSRWANAAGYSLAAVVGMLGSLSFLTATISLGLWSAAVLLWRQRTRKSAWRFAMLQAMPITAGIALWFVHVRIMRSAGGPNLGLGPILYETINYAFGMPAGSLAAYVLIPATIVFVVWQVVQMIRADDLRWMFFVGTIGAASGVLILLAGHRPLYPRYFLTNVCFLYLLLAFAMGRMWDAGRLRWIVATLMALWCVGNLVRTVEFLKVGRGDYTDAMVFIVEHTASGRPEVGSVSDERTRLLGGYYTKRFSEDRRPQFVRTRWLVQVRPEWLLFPRSPYDGIDLPSVLMLTPELSYALVKHFPATRLSGSEAGIYRRADLVGPDR